MARGRVEVDCGIAGRVRGDDGVFCGNAIFEGAEGRVEGDAETHRLKPVLLGAEGCVGSAKVSPR